MTFAAPPTFVLLPKDSEESRQYRRSNRRRLAGVIVLFTVILPFAFFLLTSCSSPPPVKSSGFSFAQLCDTQLGATVPKNGGYESDVRRFEAAVSLINRMSEVEFTMICGDLIDDKMEWEKATGDFIRIRDRLLMPCYCACGNNDVGAKPTLESLSRFRKRFGRDYYSFDHQDYTFVVANTQLWKAYVKGESEKHDAWFKQALINAKERGRSIIVIIHYPLFVRDVNEPEWSQNMPVAKRFEILERCVDAGVKVILSGHLHFRKVNEYKGIRLVSGEPTSKSFPAFGRPPTVGFNVWDIDPGKRLVSRFVSLQHVK